MVFYGVFYEDHLFIGKMLENHVRVVLGKVVIHKLEDSINEVI